MKALSFNGVTLTPVHHNSQIYLTASELAKALDYACADSVTRIYNRNADEFSPEMTQIITNSQTVNLTASTNLQTSVRIFSLRGCHLIAMFARTPVAKDFRKWVLDILDKEVGEPVMTAPIAAFPRLSPADYTTIKQAVHHIGFGMKFSDAVVHAIYARLRQLCGVDSVAHLRYEHLSIIQNELYRIDRTLAPYKKMRSETEKQLIRRICGEDELAISAAILDIESTATAYAKEGDKWLHATAEIKRIGQVGGAM